MKKRVIVSTLTAVMMTSLLSISTICAQTRDHDNYDWRSYERRDHDERRWVDEAGYNRNREQWKNRSNVEREAITLRQKSKEFKRTALRILNRRPDTQRTRERYRQYKQYLQDENIGFRGYMQEVKRFSDVSNSTRGYGHFNNIFSGLTTQYKELRKLFHQVLPVEGPDSNRSDDWYYEIMPVWLQLAQQYRVLEEQMRVQPIVMQRDYTATVHGTMEISSTKRRRSYAAQDAVSQCIRLKNTMPKLICPTASEAYNSAYQLGYKQYRVTITTTVKVSATAQGRKKARKKATRRCFRLGYTGCN